KEIVAAVIANVVAHVGNLAKQGRVLRLGFLPIGEWTCDGDVAGFKFLAEFYAQIKLQRTIRTVKMGVSDNGDVESPQESLSHNYEKEHQDLPRPRSSKAGSSPPVASMQLERHVSVVPSVRTTDFPSRSESSVSRSQANTRNSSRTPSTPSNRLQRTLTDDQSEAAISSRGALSLARVGSSSGRTSTKSTTRHNSQVSTKVIANKHRRSISGNESIVSSAGSRTRPSSKSSTKTREAWIEPSPENEAVVQRVKAKLMERCGQNGLNSLNQVLRLMDSSGDGKLSTKELKFGLRDIGIELTPSELLHVTIAFDRNEDGKIDLDEFLAALQGAPLNEKRRDLILKAFTLMDPNRSGVVSMDALRENYDVSLFPSVRAKKKSKQQALEEFLRQWEDRAAVENNDGITLDAFINYYHNISAFILDDSDFELLMRQTWHVSPSEDKESGSDQGNQRPTTSSQHSSSSRQSVISEAHRSTRTHEAKKMNSLNAEEMKNEKDQDLVETDWKYIKSLLIPAVYAPTSKPMTLDDMSRKLGANRVWGDGSEVMQGKVFAHALTLLDKQLTPKNALLLSHRVASYVTDGRNTAADGSIRLADFHCWLLSTQLRASISTSPMTESNSTNTVIDRRVAQSSGSNTATHSTVDAAALSHIGLNGLQRSLRLIDANGDKRLTKDELKAGLRKFGVDVSFHELDYLFTFFDADRSGCVSVDEFLVGMRGEMSPRRLAFVTMAFDLLDKDGDGVVTLQELTLAYDTPKHPDVINGKLAAQDALRLFAAQWESEKERDGVITKLEFEEYYQNLSASIDSDEYFELMMRNAWHISGGEGACANSTNRRVLVTKSDNMQTVEEVKNDLGIR
uniref:EF-hand domain-containing protein n=1 Tax=Globisporangium ultimum (strain ATCC 200006 / CBS 805.95 / DAOM BR144) TaxID=431595 RepID=K3WZI9_GLOUD